MIDAPVDNTNVNSLAQTIKGKGLSKKDSLDVRRLTAWRLKMRGYSEQEIAKSLEVHRNTICNDIRYMREKFKRRIIEADEKLIIGEMMAYYDEIAHDAILSAIKAAKNEGGGVKNLFYNTALRALESKFNVLIQTGVVTKAATQIEELMKIEGIGDVKKMTLPELEQLTKKLSTDLKNRGIGG
jgi:predicted DNA-binding protein (UPF0251 family)